MRTSRRRRRHLTAALLFALTVLSGCSREHAPELSMRWGVIDNYLADRFRCRITLRNAGGTALPEDGWTIYFNFGRTVIPQSVPEDISIHHINGDLMKLVPASSFRPIEPGEERVFDVEAMGSAINFSDAPAGPYIVFHNAGERPERILDLGEVEVEPFVGQRQTDRGREDALQVASPGAVFQENARYASSADAAPVSPITPTPVSTELRRDSVHLDQSLVIQYPAELSAEANLLAQDLASFFGITPALQEGEQDTSGSTPTSLITLRQGEVALPSGFDPSAESYAVSMDTHGVEVVGGGPPGVFYGTRSLLALIPPSYYHSKSGEARLPAGRVVDTPRFVYRGMHLDVARNFQSKEAVLKLLNLTSFYKLNRFHFHLTDDEGWRLEIAGLPELTTVGSRRGHAEDESSHLVPSFGSGPNPDSDESNGRGHYTRADFIEILKFAAKRHIEVVPEIDVPGHARAAIRSMEARRRRLLDEGDASAAERFVLTHDGDTSDYMSIQRWTDNVIDVCMPSTYEFLEYVIDEIVGMYTDAQVPLTTIHIGGDEVPNGVWGGSPACRELPGWDWGGEPKQHLSTYFLRRVSEILQNRGLVTAGWEEIALEARGHYGPKRPNLELLDAGLRPYVWNNVWGGGAEDLAYRLANAGFEVVMSGASNLYFDLAYEKHPLEPGYYWAGFVDTRTVFEFAPLNVFATADLDVMGHPIPPDTYADSEKLTPEGRARIIGIQGQLWGENAKGQEMMEYLAFPKLLGLAERAWSTMPGWEADGIGEDERRRSLETGWAEFAGRLGHLELPRLDVLYGGVGYRIPPPGVWAANGVVSANSTFPGLEIRFSRDGSAVDSTSEVYREPVAGPGDFVFRSFDTRGRGSRVAKPE